MQQLNVLPITVSQNVETKDDSSAFISTSSKDGFSQHIDLHLAKNKGVTHYKKEVVDDKVDENTVKASDEHTNIKVDDKINDSSGSSLALVDETDSANNQQEVAASGKNGEKELSKESLAEKDQVTDESELLMSFLIKADKTLVKDSAAESITLGAMPIAQKTKYFPLL